MTNKDKIIKALWYAATLIVGAVCLAVFFIKSEGDATYEIA